MFIISSFFAHPLLAVAIQQGQAQITRRIAVRVLRFSGAQAFGVAVGAAVGVALGAAVGVAVGAGVGVAPPEQAARTAPARPRAAAKRNGVRMGCTLLVSMDRRECTAHGAGRRVGSRRGPPLGFTARAAVAGLTARAPGRRHSRR